MEEELLVCVIFDRMKRRKQSKSGIDTITVENNGVTLWREHAEKQLL